MCHDHCKCNSDFSFKYFKNQAKNFENQAISPFDVYKKMPALCRKRAGSK